MWNWKSNYCVLVGLSMVETTCFIASLRVFLKWQLPWWYVLEKRIVVSTPGLSCSEAIEVSLKQLYSITDIFQIEATT